MEKFKNEKEVRDFFKSEMFKFFIFYDGILEMETLRSILIDGNYISFRVSLFPNDEPFLCYDTLDNMLDNMQIFEVMATEGLEDKPVELYFQPYLGK
jgi:hypothetical protein